MPKTPNDCFHQQWPSKWAGTQPANAAFHRGQLKNQSFPNFFYDILSTRYDHPSFAKHVLGRIYVFVTLFGYLVRWGGGGGSSKGWVHNLLLQFFTLVSSKIKFFETHFFDTMIT